MIPAKLINSIPSALKRHWPLPAILILAIIVNSWLITSFPAQKSWGDEQTYTQFSHRILDGNERLKKLLPGNMYFEWWPPFTYSVYGLLAVDDLVLDYQEQQQINPNQTWTPEITQFFHRVSILNLVLLLIAGSNIYIISLLLDFKHSTAALASSLFCSIPECYFTFRHCGPNRCTSC